MVTRRGLVWATDRGHVYFSSAERASVPRRLETRDSISAPLGYWPPLIIAASQDGYVYAIDERNGSTAWRYSTAAAIDVQPVVLEGVVYVIPDTGGMHAISAETGEFLWQAPGIVQFVTAGKDLLYAADRFGQMHMLDPKSGDVFDSFDTATLPIKLTNVQNDRIYLGSHTGTLLCLREIQSAKPMLHQLPVETTKPTKPPPGPNAGDRPPATEPAGNDPFGKAP